MFLKITKTFGDLKKELELCEKNAQELLVNEYSKISLQIHQTEKSLKKHLVNAKKAQKNLEKEISSDGMFLTLLTFSKFFVF